MVHSLRHMNSVCSVSRMVFAIRCYHHIIPQLMAGGTDGPGVEESL